MNRTREILVGVVILTAVVVGVVGREALEALIRFRGSDGETSAGPSSI